MCNCNQQRTIYTSEKNQSQKGVVKVILTADTSMELNGDITGRTYVFRNINDFNWVDKRDIMSMTDIVGLQILH